MVFENTRACAMKQRIIWKIDLLQATVAPHSTIVVVSNDGEAILFASQSRSSNCTMESWDNGVDYDVG